jgi:hypothetical protein
MSPNRVVAVATPLDFAPLAGAVSAWLAAHFPGFNVDQSSLEEIFIAGALIALAPAAQWLHGWQKFEARQAEIAKDVAVESTPAPHAFTAAESEDEAEFEDLDDLDDLDDLEDVEGLADVEELDDFDNLDELEAEFLAEDEEPAGIGS